MSYHNRNIPGSSRSTRNVPASSRRTTNAQRQAAPPGYHYMPDGTLMSDAEHAELYSTSPESSALPVTGCTFCSHVLHISALTPYGGYPSIFATNLASGLSTPIVVLDSGNVYPPSAPYPPPLTSATHPGFNPVGYGIQEIARWENKVIVYFFGWTLLNPQVPFNQGGSQAAVRFLEFTISEDANGECTAVGSPREIELGPGSHPDGLFNGDPSFVAHHYSESMIDENTIIGVGTDAAGNQVIASTDISGSTTSNTNILFSASGTGDIVYLSGSNSIVETNQVDGSVHHWDMSGNPLSTPLTGYAPFGNYAIWEHNGLIYMEGADLNDGIRVIGVDPSGHLYSMSDIPDWLEQNSVFYQTSDAATSPVCGENYIYYGCTDPTAQNYNPAAVVDDGSCIATVYGCTDPVALNYYGGAQVDDGSCCYTSFVVLPGSNTAVCVGAGCTDPLATNYDPLATPDDGSCVYPPPVNPCNDPWTNTPMLVQTCCDWCEENALIAGGLYGPPPVGCYDWMCDCCKPPTIKTLDLDLSDIPAEGENRTFTITGEGDGEVKFKLEVRDKDTGKYYNFVTNLFQTTEDSLEETVTGGKYSGSITFPAVTGGDDQYDIYLYAKPGTKHVKYSEARFGDNTLDINGSTGSNSLLMQKVIYQYSALTLTIRGYSPNGTVSGTIAADTVSVGIGQSKAKTAFSFTTTAAATAAYRVLRQPAQSDVLAFVQPVVGASPVNLPGENIYPTVNNTDTVDGAVTSGVKVVMDTNVADKMKVGDRITGNAALNAATVTVVALNPDGDNAKEFSMSEAIGLADGLTLSFSNQMNFSWTVNNFANVIQEGMIVVPDTNVTSETSIGTYQDTITIFENTVDEEIIIQHDQPAVSTLEKKPTVVKGLVTVQEGQITFNKQQVLALAEDTLKIGGYGESEILRVFDWEVKFTDLAITLTAPTTTTSGAVSASTTIGVASKEGVINNVSRISGIGINSKLQNPLITAGGGATGSGNLTADAAQTLENGVTLTVENTGRVATITGNIEIIRAGTSDRTLRFDVEKLLSNSA